MGGVSELTRRPGRRPGHWLLTLVCGKFSQRRVCLLCLLSWREWGEVGLHDQVGSGEEASWGQRWAE